MIKCLNTSNRGRVCLSSQNDKAILLLQNIQFKFRLLSRLHLHYIYPTSPSARAKIAGIVNEVYLLPLHEKVSLINIIF